MFCFTYFSSQAAPRIGDFSFVFIIFSMSVKLKKHFGGRSYICVNTDCEKKKLETVRNEKKCHF